MVKPYNTINRLKQLIVMNKLFLNNILIAADSKLAGQTSQ